MIVYKDILKKLKDAGYNTTRLRNEKLIPESTITRIRKNEPILTDTLNTACMLTGLPIEELVEYREDKKLKTYHIIDKRERSNNELIHYTFEEVKQYFKPSVEQYDTEDIAAFEEAYAKWYEVKDVDDLRDYLQQDYGLGTEVPYIIEEDEIEDEEARQRANDFFRNAGEKDYDYE